MEAMSGQSLQKLSGALLGYFSSLGDDLYRRDANFRELQDLVRRLTPLIAKFLQLQDISEDPAPSEWLQLVSKEYEEVDLLRQPVAEFIQLLQSSGSVKKVNENLSKLLEDAKVVEQALRLTTKTEKEHRKRGSDTSKPDVTIGGDAVVKEVIDALTSGVYPWVVIHGMGGVGKTHTAREAYNDERVRGHFIGGTYWVTISKDKPPTYVILQVLCEQILRVNNLTDFPRDLKDAVVRGKDVFNYYGNRKVLIVLDDVWHPDIVKSFDEILEDKQGVILVTTRDLGNIRCVANDTKFVDVPVLSEEESWQLFSRFAFRKRRNDHLELDRVGREVAKECKGLPLALRIIGATMRDLQLLPNELGGGKTLQSEWEKILEKLQSPNGYEDKYKELFRKLQLSVDSLAAEDPRLKACFSYFAAYPEDKRIYGVNLVDLWIAEGLVAKGDGSWNTQREVSKMLLDTLVHKSMIEREGVFYYIHDILRGLTHQNLAWDFLSKKEIPTAKRECLYAPARMSPDFPIEWIAGSDSWKVFGSWFTPGSSSGLQVRRLSLIQSRVSKLPSKVNAPRLQVLLLSDNRSLSALPPGFFSNSWNLTVLDLSYTGVEEISSEVLRGLTRLKYLNLTACERFRSVSNEINDLPCLETLLLRDCDRLEYLPRVGGLQNLHTFSAPIFKRFNLVCNHGSNPGSNKWEKWSDYFTFHGLSRYAILDLFHAGRLKWLHLRSHYIKVADEDREDDASIPDVSALVGLEELRIWSLLPPTGIMNLQNLKVLELFSLQHDLHYQIPALGELPHLEVLSLNLGGSTTFPSSFGSANAFPALKRIYLRSDNVRNIFEFCEGTMPKIKAVSLALVKLEEFPESMRNLRTVKVLEVHSCSEGVVRAVVALVKEQGNFPSLEELRIFARNKIAHKCRDGSLDVKRKTLPCLRVFESNCPYLFM